MTLKVSYRIPASGLQGPQVGNTLRIAAIGETTGWRFVPRRAFDLPLLVRFRLAAWCREARRCVPAIRFRQWSVQCPSASIIQYEAGVGQPERPSFLLRDEILRWAYAEIDAKSD